MIDTNRPPVPRGHICWAYDDPASLVAPAERYLTDGLIAGERVWYVTPRSPEAVAGRLGGIAGFADALRRGAAAVIPLGATYSAEHVFDPAEQVATYAAATGAALAAGYTGLRVVAEATRLVDTPQRLDSFARYEHLIDRQMRTRPFRAMCAYDRSELGEQVIAELACLHPETNVETALFQLYAISPDDGQAALTGELDMSNHELFRTALDRADLRPVDGELVLWASDLRFLDHRALAHLGEYAHRRGATAVLRTSRSAAARLAALLDLPHIRVEVAR